MDYDVGGLLAGLFGGTAADCGAVPVVALSPLMPEPSGEAIMPLAALPPPAMSSTLWLDDEAEPLGPCPRCGGLEPWWDGLGRRRCAECEGNILGRAVSLAATAARLRENQPPRMPAVVSAGTGSMPTATGP